MDGLFGHSKLGSAEILMYLRGLACLSLTTWISRAELRASAARRNLLLIGAIAGTHGML